MLLEFLSVRVGDRETAKDLTQETLARAWHRWDRLQSYRDPLGWCFRVAANLANSHHRRTAVSRRFLAILRKAGAPDDHIAADPYDVGDTLKIALSQLSVRQQQVVALRFIVDLSVEDTAEALGWPEGTVKSTSARALDALRKSIGDGIVSSSDLGIEEGGLCERTS